MSGLEIIEKKDAMQEQLDKRDMILRYFKQVDYNLKPSREIYTRIKTKIIGLSGINAKPDLSYAELCKMADLDLKEGKALISSLFNKELIHMIKKYDALLINQEVEAFYIDKQYVIGEAVPDIAMISHEQAVDYIISLIGMNVILRTINSFELEILTDGINKVPITMIADNDRQRLHKVLMSQNRMSMFRLASSFDELIVNQGLAVKPNITKIILEHCIESIKRVDLLQGLLCDAVKKNPNVNNKFYAGSCEVNDTRYYLFPI